MKKILLVCVLAMCALTSSAQFMNSSQGVRKSSGVQSNEAPRVINSVKFTYSPMTMDGANFFEDKDEMELNGLSLAWTQSRAILQNLPLYVEYGLGLQYSFKADSQKIEDEYDTKIADEAYEEYINNGKESRPIEELWEELDI